MRPELVFRQCRGSAMLLLSVEHEEIPVPEWPKDKLLRNGPDLPMAERIRRYQHNIRTIRTSGCVVPTPSMVDTLDPAEIEIWFADKAFTTDRLDRLIRGIADLPAETEFPSLLIPLEKDGDQ
ncbi:hypothetical protein [Agrobacterium tumefaciens]|uniref:hypothetical protein n=1 Tax=Agrobacterium tumefaciens TaxID=358 RepID=UPI001FCD529C|nr:hypothetical protein [Agrobacterium tumefaciens]